ncbi:hypothetical protein KC340_g9258 [Hortaea werneckii]|nr:hypothetical protein KC342_g9641 [Hortaea werneckii]KAI7314686.1 hypothetical protein KC340_g9258 [Hortaea werneckii]
MASLTNKNDAGVKIAFKCEGCILDVDVAAVCARSNMIKAIKAMVDAALTDSSNARIIFTDEAHTLLLMLEYIYLGHYDVRDTFELPTGLVHGKHHPAISHIRVHAFGKKYKVSGLATLALEKLRCPESYIAAEDFVGVLRVAYQYSAEETDDVRTDLLAVALARFDNVVASQVILTQLAEFEELRDFAAQLLPHISRFAAVRLSKSNDQNAKLVAHKNETIQLLETEVSTHKARADIHIGKFCAMREKYEGELIKSDGLEKLLTARSKQLEVAMARIADLESASSRDPAQGDASKTQILGLQNLLKYEQARAARTQTQLDQSDLKVQRLQSQVRGCEAKIRRLQSPVHGHEAKTERLQSQIRGCEAKNERLQSQIRGCEAKIERLQSQVRGYEGKLQRLKSEKRDLLGMIKIVKPRFLELNQQAREYRRERDEAREKLRRDAKEASEISRKASSAKSWYQMQDLRQFTPLSAPSSFFMPPSFAEQAYWDQRFRDNRNAFEWLLPPPDVAQLIGDIIRDASIDSPRILHIGAGTSNLSSHLKNLISDSKDVCNTDFSKEAVAVGKALEAEQVQAAGELPRRENVDECLTLWEQSNHLSADDTKQLLHSDGNNGRLFNTIVDKSTSDAISCGLDVEITLPYAINSNTTSQTNPDSSAPAQIAKVHPLHLLAVHLAALTEPSKGRWVVVSYNEDRFPFFSPFVATHAEGALRDDIIDAGFPDPKRLWTLVEKRQIKVPPPSSDGGIVTQARRVVHTPDVFHWVYVLARTDVQLTMRDSASG